MKSYWRFLNAKILAQKENYLEAYEFFVLSLDGDQFDPLFHQKIKQEIAKITKVYSTKSVNLNKMFYNQNKKERKDSSFLYSTQAILT